MVQGREGDVVLDGRGDAPKRLLGLHYRVLDFGGSDAFVHHRRGNYHPQLDPHSSRSSRPRLHQRDCLGVLRQVKGQAMANI